MTGGRGRSGQGAAPVTVGEMAYLASTAVAGPPEWSMGRDECLARLALEPVGRLVVPQHGCPPVVVPAVFRLLHQCILIRTTRLVRRPPPPGRIAFEVDRIDMRRREGWSVVVEGVPGTGGDLPLDDLEPPGHWIRLDLDDVRGRRIGGGGPLPRSGGIP